MTDLRPADDEHAGQPVCEGTRPAGSRTARQDKAAPAEPSFWTTFSRSDFRLLVVTIAGTLAANVVTVAVVAIAVILARYFFSPKLTGGQHPGMPELVIAAVALFAIYVTALWRIAKALPLLGGAFRRMFMVIAPLVGAFVVLVGLVLLGVAAGVK